MISGRRYEIEYTAQDHLKYMVICVFTHIHNMSVRGNMKILK